MSEIKKQVLTLFSKQVDLSPEFIKRLAELYNRLSGNEGLDAEEWQEYREKSRMFTDQIIQWLLKQKEQETASEKIQFHKDIIMSYVNWRGQISASRSIPEETHVADYLREFYVPYEPDLHPPLFL